MSFLARVHSAAKEGRLAAGLCQKLGLLPATPSLLDREHFYAFLIDDAYNPTISYEILLRGNFYTHSLGILLKTALEAALKNEGVLPDFVRAIDGMSGQKYRTFINNLVCSHEDARYLEIGSWSGSTATAALVNNTAEALCVDNWSQFDGPRDRFFENINRILSPSIRFRFVESDFRKLDYREIGKFNIFLFDGPHGEADQYDGIMLARPALDDAFVLIVDDWNWRNVRVGTFRAIVDSNYRIAASIEIRTTNDNSHAKICGKYSDWHNGYFIAAIESCRKAGICGN
jgi:Methyltransferase domain